MTKMTTSTRSPGRPRDNKVGPSLLAAARQLVLQHGYCGVSIQMIATEAGVGRQTLYRRWPSKAELVLAAFLESAGDADVLSDGRAEKRLLHFLVNVFRNLQQDGPAIRNLIASAQDDPEFLKSFRAGFVEPRAEIVATIFVTALQTEKSWKMPMWKWRSPRFMVHFGITFFWEANLMLNSRSALRGSL